MASAAWLLGRAGVGAAGTRVGLAWSGPFQLADGLWPSSKSLLSSPGQQWLRVNSRRHADLVSGAHVRRWSLQGSPVRTGAIIKDQEEITEARESERDGGP